MTFILKGLFRDLICGHLRPADCFFVLSNISFRAKEKSKEVHQQQPQTLPLYLQELIAQRDGIANKTSKRYRKLDKEINEGLRRYV